MTRLAVLLILMLLSLTSAQGVQVREFAGVTHVSLQDVATVLGEAATRVGDSVTLRTPFGVLTLFSGSQDGFWRAAAGGAEVELRLALPLREDRGVLWAPLSLLTQLGGTVSGRVVVLPDRTRLLLEEAATPGFIPVPALPGAAVRSENVELGNGVQGIRLFSGNQSLLLVDLGLLSLALPGQRAEFDSIMLGLQGERPLYFVLTSREDAPLDPELSLSQSGVTVRSEMLAANGSFDSVGPESPVTGIVLLPERFNPRAQLTVQWQGVSATAVLRR